MQALQRSVKQHTILLLLLLPVCPASITFSAAERCVHVSACIAWLSLTAALLIICDKIVAWLACC
jgi:hypothetical protein